ncbi:MAG TPA: FAD-linked oxidase C-terminal domain-containing protein [Chthoniobacterales bacterium]|jgi:glycolate dehydrogenase FAD-linked subunit|nr:FAD-linked oxidase C-terminal domain-containing protein [Chthoniobacterales bacterium]
MKLADELRQLFGNELIADDEATITAHSSDKWFATEAPEVVAFARSTSDVSKLLTFASERKIPVTARGAGFGYVGGCVPAKRGIALSLMRMNRIKDINFADAVAVVEPGVITAELKAAARAQKLFYPPDPASMKDCSIGGNVATNAGGPRCLKYGVTRSYVIGLEVVLANGDVLRNGGRVHKNKTGFDLIGLFVGSEGLLGVVTEITLRLLPLPPARATISAAFAKMSEAAAIVQEIFAKGFLPASLEIADSFTLEAARKDLGQALVPEGNAHLLVDLDGQDESVRSEAGAIRKLIASKKPNALELATGEEDCEKLWALRRQFSNSLRATGLTKLNEDVVVPRGRIVDLVEFAERLSAKSGFPIACFGHAGDGNIHINIMADRYNREAAVREKVEAALDDLFAQILAWGGVITGEHGIGLAKKRWWPDATSEPVRELHRKLKNILDPNGILNPGKFVD